MGRPRLNRERLNITLPEGLGEQLLKYAQEHGWTRSDVLEELARAHFEGRPANLPDPQGAAKQKSEGKP